MKRYRVVTTDGLVLALRQGLLEACERAKREALLRKLAVLVVRDDNWVVKMCTTEVSSAAPMWRRIMKAQPQPRMPAPDKKRAWNRWLEGAKWWEAA